MDGISRERFRSVGVVTLIYGLFFTFCLYRNLSGVMTAFLAVATVAYIWYAAPRLKGYRNESKMFAWWDEPCRSKEEEKTGDDFEVVTPQEQPQESMEAAEPQEAEVASRGWRARQKCIYPYYIGIILLGISTFFTADSFVIGVNYAGMLLLVFCALIRIFYEEGNWGFGKYMGVGLNVGLSPILYPARIIQDYVSLRKSDAGKKKAVVGYIAAGVICAIPVLIIVVPLLSFTDAVFEKLTENLFENICIPTDIISVLLLFAVVTVYVYGLAVKLPDKSVKEEQKEKRHLNPITGITFAGLLTAVYMLYSGIQILGLFMREKMLPEGYTYSGYARHGFFELLFVSCLNLFIVLICLRLFKKNRALDIVLTVMSGCTYVMLASSLMRMLMYIKEYYLTYLRVLVLLVLLMIAVVMAGIIARIWSTHFPLVHYTIFTVGAIWIVFSFCRPEYIIARYNLSHLEGRVMYESWRYGDLSYVCSLGEDAAPALYDFVADSILSSEDSDYANYWSEYVYSNYFEAIEADYEAASSVRGFNVAKFQAYIVTERLREQMDGM